MGGTKHPQEKRSKAVVWGGCCVVVDWVCLGVGFVEVVCCVGSCEGWWGLGGGGGFGGGEGGGRRQTGVTNQNAKNVPVREKVREERNRDYDCFYELDEERRNDEN